MKITGGRLLRRGVGRTNRWANESPSMVVTESDFPGMARYPHRRFIYMELPSGGTLEDGMSLLTDACLAIDSSANAAVIEERATIELPSGKQLRGISFKTEHQVVLSAIDRVASDTQLIFGEIDGDDLRMWNGDMIGLGDCTLSQY